MMYNIHWQIMFRVSDQDKARRELRKAMSSFNLKVSTEAWAVEKYHKIPELWVCSYTETSSALPSSELVQNTLINANSIGKGWLVFGPILNGERLVSFEGVFSKENGRTAVSIFEWGQFSVSQMEKEG